MCGFNSKRHHFAYHYVHFVFLRHATKVDNLEDSTGWVSNFDPPVNATLATDQVEECVKSLNHVINPETHILLHTSPYNRCMQTSGMLAKALPTSRVKIRVDQGLGEWLSTSCDLTLLPPNDNGISLMSNVNSYINDAGLQELRDMTWNMNRFSRGGQYGELLAEFKLRCLNYLKAMIGFYTTGAGAVKDENTVVFVVSHGPCIVTFLQLLICRPIFNEIPSCVPFSLHYSNFLCFKEYGSFLDKSLKITRSEADRILDLSINNSDLSLDRMYKEYEPPVPRGRSHRKAKYSLSSSEDSSEESSDDDEGIVIRSRSSTLNSIRVRSRGNTESEVSRLYIPSNLKESPPSPLTVSPDFGSRIQDYYVEDKENVAEKTGGGLAEIMNGDSQNSDDEYWLGSNL